MICSIDGTVAPVEAASSVIGEGAGDRDIKRERSVAKPV